jgi:hypothetical protein
MSEHDDKIREELLVLALEQQLKQTQAFGDIEQLLKNAQRLFQKHERVQNLWLGQLGGNVGNLVFLNAVSMASVGSSNNTENEGLLKSFEFVKGKDIQVKPGDHFVLGNIKLDNIQEGDRVVLNASATYKIDPAPPQSGSTSVELVLTRERLDNVLFTRKDSNIQAGTEGGLSFAFVDDTPVEGKNLYSVSIKNGGLGLTIKQFTFTAQVLKPNE